VEKILWRDGCVVESFLCAGDALKCIREGDVDLVVCDLMMPTRTGLDLLREMNAAGVAVPMVIITGYAGVESSLESFGLGAMDYLPKPFTVQELRTSVKRALRGRDVDPITLPRPPCETFVIRHHSWARPSTGGTVLLGAHPFLLRCCGTVQSIEVAHEDDELAQGGCFGSLVVDDSGVPARLWSPVAGEVAAVNRNVVDAPALLATDPYGDGWLVRMRPRNLEEDLKVITRTTFP